MLEVILAFIGSFCVGVLFNVKRAKLLWTGLSGTLGWIAFSWIYRVTGDVVLPTFIGAVMVGIYSECAARILKSPATIFSISGIFPLVPGIAAYNTIQYIVENRLNDAASKAVETMTCALAIAFGIMLVTAVFRFAGRLKEVKRP